VLSLTTQEDLMGIMRTRRIAMAAALGTVALGGAVGASAAQSAGPGPQPVEVASNTALGHVAAALPSGCYGQTDRPHNSTHEPGSINVVARTVCPGLGVHVDTALYRSRWYGWQQRGSGANNGVGSTSTNAAESAADCSGTHDYLGSSYHEASNGAWARTSNRVNKLTC
jgi:hypothetical protein